MKHLSKVVEQIKRENIRPKPRWIFTLKNLLIWVGFVLFVIFGALAFSVILFAIQQTDFNVISHVRHSKLELFLGLLPFFWIVSLLVFLVLSILSIQNSKRGYKFSASRMVCICVAFSILLGTLFFIGGGAKKLEQAFSIHLTIYESIQEKKVKIWTLPEDGYLSGTIVEINSESFEMEDFEGKSWIIHYQEAFIPPSVFFEKGGKIRMIGKMIDKKEFNAEQIRPWGGMGSRFERKPG
ncbi:MAG: hypothetical protein GY705_00750, partial [Bacteroidetes bacterium]|nr:hypothetical protein [Bacteroidota bacterium]